MRRVMSDAQLHRALNDGEREVEAVAGEGFALLRTLGRDRPGPMQGRAQTLDVIRVEAAGCQPYVAANAVVAGLWARSRVWRRRSLVAVMGNRRLAVQATSLAVCNGQFVAGGRWLAPRAHPADGRLGVLVDGNQPMRARRLASRMVLGEHVPDRRVHQLRPVAVTVDGPAWWLEADGVARRGRLPARFAVLPGALTLWL